MPSQEKSFFWNTPSPTRRAWQKGLLTGTAPAAYLVLAELYGGAGQRVENWQQGLFLGMTLLLGVGGVTVEKRPTLGRLLATAALAVTGGTALMRLFDAPGAMLVLLLSLIGAISWMWSQSVRETEQDAGRGEEFDPLLSMRVVERQAALVGGLGSWLLAVSLGGTQGIGMGLVLATLGLSTVRGARQLTGDRSGWRVSPRVAIGAGVLDAVCVALLWDGLPTLTAGLAGAGGIVLVALRRPRAAERLREAGWWEPLVNHPARLLTATFLGTCLLGGLVLALPVCAAHSGIIGPLDAIFTAVSATCVTGLIVLDTPHDFSAFGQGVILLLIQIGGLGIMTFSTATLVLLRQRLGLRYEGTMVEIVGSRGRGELTAALQRMLGVTFAAEVLGGAVLAVAFWNGGDPLLTAVWRGGFTAVSAYCNAGFALQTDSLAPYQQGTLVLHLVALLIIVGGLGPAVIAELPALLRGRRVSLHTRLVLGSSLLLLLVPAVLIGALEWGNTLTGLSVWERLANAWFQSATTRTAGFNSIDLTALRPATLTLLETLMFIGGSPGSTAGGIKTTTCALLVLTIGTALRGRSAATAGGWRIPHVSVYKAATVLTLGLLAVMVGLFAVQLTQVLDFHSALFEIISALGTVGLSIGGTAQLDDVGKVIVMICMFVGRVGPLTLFLTLGTRRQREPWRLPEQEIAVG